MKGFNGVEDCAHQHVGFSWSADQWWKAKKKGLLVKGIA